MLPSLDEAQFGTDVHDFVSDPSFRGPRIMFDPLPRRISDANTDSDTK